MPYGPRPASEVLEFTRQALRWFASRDCKLIVIACNTATSAALETVRDEVSVPLIGVVRPGAAAAIAASARRAIGVLATAGTVRSGAYVRAVRDLDPLADVIQQPCPKLVSIVEEGKAGTPEALAAVRGYVEPLLTEGGVVTPVVDTLLLGCTHYPLLREEFAKVAGPGVRVVDSATTTALAVREVLVSHRLLAGAGGTGPRGRGPSSAPEGRVTASEASVNPHHEVYATGSADRFRAVARTIFGEDVPVSSATLS